MPTPPIDLRKHAKQTKKRLVWAGLGLIFVVGVVLIALTYGTPAAGCGLAFFLAAMVPVALVILVLYFLQWLVDRTKNDDSRGG
jgi:Na+/proline symporter